MFSREWLRPSVLCAALAVSLWGVDGRADPATVEERGRSLVRMRALGHPNPSRLSSLQTLIEAELVDAGVKIVVEDTTESVPQWVTSNAADPEVLVIVVLDTRQSDHWQVMIVDAARRRGIRRRLPGGVAEDAAAVEAVASIVVSAVTALRDGLEVASQPVDEVLEGASAGPPKAEPDSDSSRQSEDGSSRQSRAGGESDAQSAGPTPGALALRLTLLGTVASFADAKPTTLGLGGGLGGSYAGWSTRLSGARFEEVRFDSEFGQFRAVRNWIGLGFGPHFEFTDFELEAEGRIFLEIIKRQSGPPATGVTPLADAQLTRFGALGGLRARYPARSALGFELMLGAGYLPSTVRFVTSPNNFELAELWRWLLLAELGLQFSIH